MTALHAIALAVGMALIGARLVSVLVLPIAGAVVDHTVSHVNQEPVMMLVAQSTAAISTFLVGTLVFHIPWYGSLPAALFVGVTTYVRRDPD